MCTILPLSALTIPTGSTGMVTLHIIKHGLEIENLLSRFMYIVNTYLFTGERQHFRLTQTELYYYKL